DVCVDFSAGRRRPMRRSIIFALVICCLALVVRPAAAQETVNLASLSGRVLDPQRAVVPGATITALHVETNVTAEATSDRDGRFRFPYLKVGTYEITVHLDGFADSTRRLTVTVGSAFDLPISLNIAGVTADVTVTAQATV